MTNKLIIIIEIFCMLFLSGCSSIYTLTEDPEEIHKEACATGCSVIPRIYSGTAMDLCGVFSEDGGQGSAIMFYDLFLSIPVDTIVLPYTIIRQITDGNLSVSSECEATPPNNALNSQVTPAGTPQSGAH